ncbi:MAG TPA: MarR family winged helix-turn-helix transcriptional regulator [Jatrophihabitans sp.]|nr:MarR family winged helix-turn-helix transcriptional regulator [Jatrophihabitans sp.]
MPTIGEGFRGPEGRVGFLLRQAHQAFRAAAQASLEPLGLTLPQYSVLSVAHALPGSSGAELARESMVTAQTANEIITTLVDAGLLARRADSRDRRLRRLEVTPAGRTLLSRARRAVYAVEHRMTASLRPAQSASLRSWLADCAANLTDQAYRPTTAHPTATRPMAGNRTPRKGTRR